MITLAISKGRIWDEACRLLTAIDCAPQNNDAQSRSLIIATQNPQVRLIMVRAQDVPTYVASGAADAGISGGDVLAENNVSDIYQPLDLGIARCRLVAAAPLDFDWSNTKRKLTVATKYTNLARHYFNQQGIHANYIKLYGTMELAPLVGLADVIVDITQTGNTLKDNGLKEVALLRHLSAMFIVNRRSTRKNDLLQDTLEKLTIITKN